MPKQQKTKKVQATKVIKQDASDITADLKTSQEDIKAPKPKKTPKEPKSPKESIAKFSELPGKLDSLKDELIQYRKADNKEAVIERIHNFALFMWRLRYRIKVGKCLWDDV